MPPIVSRAFQAVRPQPMRELTTLGRNELGNGFRLNVISGPNPPVVGGPFAQGRQAASLASLLPLAELSIGSKGGHPGDREIGALLNKLSPTPLLNGRKAILEYTSTIPNAKGVDTSSAAVFDTLVKNPNKLFEAAGLKIRPAASELRDGARIILEDSHVMPGLWFPVEVKLDRAARTVTFHTLDGHPLRGTNAFTFKDAGAKGTQVLQRSEFQSSSLATSFGSRVSGATEHQHEVWKDFQAALYRQFFPAR